MKTAGDATSDGSKDISKAPVLCSQRWNLAALGFFGTLFVYTVRVNMSVAIICMVRVPPPLNESLAHHALEANTTQYPIPEVGTALPIREPGIRISNISIILMSKGGKQSTLESSAGGLPEADGSFFPEGGTPIPEEGNSQTRGSPLPEDEQFDRDDFPLPESEKYPTNGLPFPEDEKSSKNGGSMTDEFLTEADMEDSCEGDFDEAVSSLATTGEFDWSKATRSRVLAMYFYGYIFTQIPGGLLATRYGGRRVWGVCQAVCALCTLLTPLAARTNINLVYVLRFILGLGAGVSFPCTHAMMGRWAPKLERSVIVAFVFAGAPVGTILTFSLSALLCSYGFDNGWGSIFYLAGAGNILWVVVWFLTTADTPAKHRKISDKERNYILSSIGERPDTKEKIATPWLSMLKSGPLWAIIVAHMCNNYTNYTLLTSLPAFMKEVLKFDIKKNGALSALPYACQSVSSILFGNLADCLRARGILSTKMTRIVMQSSSFIGAAVCIGSAGFMTCEQRPLSVFIICLCLSFMGLNRAGYTVNHIDLAPRHAGVLFGISNTVATIPGMIAPLVAGAFTPNGTAEEWRNVFYVCSGTAIFGAVVYGLLADGELQDWAVPPSVEIIITGESDDDVKKARDIELKGLSDVDPSEGNETPDVTTPKENDVTDAVKPESEGKETDSETDPQAFGHNGSQKAELSGDRQ